MGNIDFSDSADLYQAIKKYFILRFNIIMDNIFSEDL